MTDEYRRRGQGGNRAFDVIHIVGKTHPGKIDTPLTFAVTGQRQRVRGETVLGEPRQKIFIPAPGAGIGAVHKQQGYRMGWTDGRSGDQFKAPGGRHRTGTSSPRCTAGRAEISSYQRWT